MLLILYAADTTSKAEARKLADRIRKKGGKDLKAVRENLVDKVWGKNRPSRPSEQVVPQPFAYSGKTIDAKLSTLRKEMDKKKCSGFIVCEYVRAAAEMHQALTFCVTAMLDEIAWMYNLRGSEYVLVVPVD